jgi:catechol 2,3-dioxygenase-like lactoylglutathione lyase family enzyme
MLINSIFASNLSEAKSYYKAVLGLLKKFNGEEQALPHFYYLDKEQLDMERLEPGSQQRIASLEIEQGSTHLWTQSIWFICQILG